MNWRLIFSLSLFGLVMAFATTYVIPSIVEPFCWLVIFFICAYLTGKYAPGKFYKHGFLTGLVNCVWVTSVHILLSPAYLAHHAQEAQQYAKMNREIGLTPTMAMLVMGPIAGIISGGFLGLFCLMASKFVTRTPQL